MNAVPKISRLKSETRFPTSRPNSKASKKIPIIGSLAARSGLDKRTSHARRADSSFGVRAALNVSGNKALVLFQKIEPSNCLAFRTICRELLLKQAGNKFMKVFRVVCTFRPIGTIKLPERQINGSSYMSCDLNQLLAAIGTNYLPQVQTKPSNLASPLCLRFVFWNH